MREKKSRRWEMSQRRRQASARQRRFFQARKCSRDAWCEGLRSRAILASRGQCAQRTMRASRGQASCTQEQWGSSLRARRPHAVSSSCEGQCACGIKRANQCQATRARVQWGSSPPARCPQPSRAWGAGGDRISEAASRRPSMGSRGAAASAWPQALSLEASAAHRRGRFAGHSEGGPQCVGARLVRGGARRCAGVRRAQEWGEPGQTSLEKATGEKRARGRGVGEGTMAAISGRRGEGALGSEPKRLRGGARQSREGGGAGAAGVGHDSLAQAFQGQGDAVS